MIVKRKTMSPAELAELEYAKAQAERNAANIDYIAMMADIELFGEEALEDE